MFAETLSPSQFRDVLAKAVEVVTKVPTEIVDDRTFIAKQVDGTSHTISIDNAYIKYLADPNSLEGLAARFADTLAKTSGKTDEPIDQLVVIVRQTDYISRSFAPDASVENFSFSRPLAGDISYFLAVDSQNAIRTASKNDFTRWNTDEASAWRRAISNVKARVGPLEIIRLGDENGPSGLAAESGLAPSILADPSFCSSERPDGMRAQILLLFSRDVLLFAVPSDREMLARFWKHAKSLIKDEQTLSSTPITCKNGKWQAVPIP